MHEPVIAICVATFHRPKGLERLLNSLKDLEVEGFQPKLIVADNDTSESSRSVVENFRDQMPFPLMYVIEPQRGIASARNRLVTEARNLQVDFIAFTDDDVTVKPDWIKQSLEQARATEADVVVGRQCYIFDNGTPAHIRLAFEPAVLRIGDPGIPFSTANLLINVSALCEIDGPFDVRFNLTGGSDSMLEAQLLSRGKRIEHARDSIVYEHVPTSRVTTRWILKRGYRTGLNNTRIRLSMAHSGKELVVYVVKSTGFLAVSTIQLIRCLMVNREDRMLWMRTVASALGRFHGLLNRNAEYEEYKKILGE